MKSYPVSVLRDHYRGTNERRRQKAHEYNRIAARIEDYINSDLEKQSNDSINQYFSRSVAYELREDEELVRRIIYSIDCGHNGVTIVKGDYERAMQKLSIPPEAPADAP